ncbi:endo-1,4-beta-xylanase [bacterium]|nr:endo-1,4-beta-xylanase [bacterium]
MKRFLSLLRAVFLLASIVLLALPCFSQLADGKNKFLGCIIKSGQPVPDDFDMYWNQVTPENAGKWGSVESMRDVMNWGELDRAYNYAKDYGFPFRFHVLVWGKGKQQPLWIDNLDSLEQAEEVEEWIKLAGERYPDADYVEPVNEPIEWPPWDYYPTYRNALGGAGETGWDWVIWAFEKARQYFPNSKLYLNEYQLFGGNKSIATYLKIVNLLKERNLIDGVCEQGHFIESVSAKTIQRVLDQLAGTGLPIQITELHIQFKDDAQQLAKYQALFPVMWKHPSVEGITLWGYREGEIYYSDAYLVRNDGTERPAMEWLRDYVTTTAVEKSSGPLPERLDLQPNFPNPFNPSTRISYSIPGASDVRLSVYNAAGREVAVLVNARQSAGSHQATFNGEAFSSGVYLCRLQAGGQMKTRKMIFMK